MIEKPNIYLPHIGKLLGGIVFGLAGMLTTETTVACSNKNPECVKWVKNITKELDSPSEHTRKKVYIQLCHYIKRSDEKTKEGFLDVFVKGTEDPSDKVRRRATECLSEYLHKPQAVETLHTMTLSNGKQTRNSAFYTIKSNPTSENLRFLLSELSTADCKRRGKIYDTLTAYSGEAVVQPIIEDTKNQLSKGFPCNRGPKSRRGETEAYVLGPLPDKLRKTFIPELLSDSNAEVVLLGVKILGWYPTEWGNQQLESTFDHENYLVVTTAISNLANSGLPSAKDALEKLAKSKSKHRRYAQQMRDFMDE